MRIGGLVGNAVWRRKGTNALREEWDVEASAACQRLWFLGDIGNRGIILMYNDITR